MDLSGEHFKAYVFIEMKRGKSPSEIIEQLKESGADNVPGNSAIYLWVKQFKEGTRTSRASSKEFSLGSFFLHFHQILCINAGSQTSWAKND